MHTAARPVEWNRTLMRADQKAKGWNDTKLAKKARVHQSTVTRWFAGKTSNPDLGAKLAKALGFSSRRYLVADEAVAS